MEEQKSWVWLFISPFLFLPVIGLINHDEDFSIQCNQSDVTIRISLAYLENLTSSLPSDVYLVNATNPTKLELCRLTKTNTEFVITTNSTIFDFCFGSTETTNGGVALRYTAQLFPTPRSEQLISFDSMYQWKFQCLFQDSYNISESNHILPFATSFMFNTSTVNQNFNVTAEFYADNAFTTPFNPQGSGVKEGDPVHLLISVDGESNLEISLPECHIRNQQSDAVDVISQGCPTANVTGTNVTRVSRQAIGVSFPAFLIMPQMDEIHQFLTIHCAPFICDSLVTNCSDSGCVLRKRRKRAIGNSNKVTARLHVVSHCNLVSEVKHFCLRHIPGAMRRRGCSPPAEIKSFNSLRGLPRSYTQACSEICMYDKQTGYFCVCSSDSILQENGLTCVKKGSSPLISKDNQQDRPNTQKTTTKRPKTHPITSFQNIRHLHQESSGPGMIEKTKARGFRDAVNPTVILLYFSLGLLILLCILLLVSIVQKWWIRRQYEKVSDVKENQGMVILAE